MSEITIVLPDWFLWITAGVVFVWAANTGLTAYWNWRQYRKLWKP